jgi:hypothetical protein
MCPTDALTLVDDLELLELLKKEKRVHILRKYDERARNHLEGRKKITD